MIEKDDILEGYEYLMAVACRVPDSRTRGLWND